MTPAEMRARRAWHRAILAVTACREVSGVWLTWRRAALAWESDRRRAAKRRRAGRYKRVPEHLRYRPRPRLVGLNGRPLREAIAAAVRERRAA